MTPLRVLVIGRSGQIARSLALRAELRPGIALSSVGRPDLDLARPETVAAALAASRPDIVVNAAAYTAVDAAEADEAGAFRVNGDGAGAVAAAAAARGLPVIHLSTDYVFSGTKAKPYTEDDVPAPRNAYGRSKLAGERAVAAANSRHVVLRTAWLHSPFGRNFVTTMLRLAEGRDEIGVVGDQYGNPTYAADAADGILTVAERLAEGGDALAGTFHMVSQGEASWADLAEAVFHQAARAGAPSARVRRISTPEYKTAAHRPANSRLDMNRFVATFGHAIPPWREGVELCVRAALRARS